MISDNISLDKLLSDLDQQIEVLSAIAADSTILAEQLRLLLEAREQLVNQQLELERLQEMLIDSEPDAEFGTTIIHKHQLRDQPLD